MGRIFPVEWKEAKLVLILQPRKEDSLRANCNRSKWSLNLLGKVFGGLSKNRLAGKLVVKPPISEE